MSILFREKNFTKVGYKRKVHDICVIGVKKYYKGVNDWKNSQILNTPSMPLSFALLSMRTNIGNYKPKIYMYVLCTRCNLCIHHYPLVYELPVYTNYNVILPKNII